jgi:hypothetical protein
MSLLNRTPEERQAIETSKAAKEAARKQKLKDSIMQRTVTLGMSNFETTRVPDHWAIMVDEMGNFVSGMCFADPEDWPKSQIIVTFADFKERAILNEGLYVLQLEAPLNESWGAYNAANYLF